MLCKDKFRYAEKQLYDYKRNLAAMAILNDDLEITKAGNDVHAQTYESKTPSAGTVSDPVHARLMKIENIQQRLAFLERLTNPITRLVRDLDSEDILIGSNNIMLREILRLMYFGRNTPDIIMRELNISSRTFSRKRRELVFLAMDYMAI